jgi:two-component system sensor histidine kinase RegB
MPDAQARPPAPAPLPAPALLPARRADWVALRTLTGPRWVAIAGQSAAVAVAAGPLGLAVPVGPASLVIGASILVNLVATVTMPRTRRLSEREAAGLLTFDILQLGLLLALTGGLANPFAVLILAPATIAASVLGPRLALLLAGLTLAVIPAIGVWHLPLATPEGPLAPPPLFLWGFALALATGVAFLGLYARSVTAERAAMADALAATQMALSRAQRLADLDGVVAAAAHEMGTPLATIKLVTSEMIAALGEDTPDREALLEDARLLREQADRCRDILRAMGREGRRDPYLDRAPLSAVVDEAAAPHRGRGKALAVLSPEGRQPDMPRRPEIVHGLRNLVQNAVDFAQERVEIRLDWGPGRVAVRIVDDGPGFPPSLIDRLGDPFVTRRGGTAEAGAGAADPREAYEGMGLGLFIAKTLLERTGARVSFANGPQGGAVAVVAWPPEALLPPEGERPAPASSGG